LRPGRYFVGVFNPTSVAQSIFIRAFITLDLAAIVPTKFTYTGPTAIPDDAVSTTSLFVPIAQKIVSVDVGVRIDHPRVSDLVLHLISPDGTRGLLDENRGANTPNGMGYNLFFTNIIPVTASGGPDAQTNVIETGQTSGTIGITWDFLDVPDWMHVYYDGNLIMDTGVINGTGS